MTTSHTYIVLRGLLFDAILFPASLLLSACGVKNGYVTGKYGTQPLNGEVFTTQANESAQPVKGTMGLLWQADTLRITLNQGRKLLRARSTKDTLYLYEAPRDTANLTTRQYAVYLPQRELFIIKYNDSLVYPVMPTTSPCHYPLEIKSMSTKNLNNFKKKQEENKNKPQTQPVLSPNYEIYPSELRAGTYLWNVGRSQTCTDCSCMVDSSKVLLLNVDGSWLQYSNKNLINCGIMRKTKSPVYEMLDYKKEIVYFLDTTAFNGHIIGIKEDKRRWEENIPYVPNEYLCIGKHSIISHKLFPCRQDSTMLLFFEYGDNFILEGTRCGWEKISNN